MRDLWAVVCPYGLTHHGRRPGRIVSGAFSPLPESVPLILDHVLTVAERRAEADLDQLDRWMAGVVTDFVDRPEALYGRLVLDDPAGCEAAATVLRRIARTGESYFSPGFADLSPEGSTVTTEAVLIELSSVPTGGFPQTRILTRSETERLLAGESLVLKAVAG